MVANTDKGRMISLCGSGIDVFEQRSADEQTAVLDALQQFKNGSKVAPTKPSALGTQTNVTLPGINKPSDSEGFFKTRTGLYVWDGFTNRILSVTKVVESLPAVTISLYDLIKPATDSEIRAELPEGNVFQGASVFCGYLAGLINQQKNGEEGNLLNNGRANIFYVVGKNSEVFAVGVLWDSGYRLWDVSACQLVGIQWSAGNRVFSATAP